MRHAVDVTSVACVDDAGGALGCPEFRADYGVRLAYVAGAMGKGVASERWVAALARAGILSFFGAGGLPLDRIAAAIAAIRSAAGPAAPFGVNFLHNQIVPRFEDALTDLLLAEQVRTIEASAFVRVTPALVRYRLAGLEPGPDGAPHARNRILAKLSRPEVARQFLAPPDPRLVADLRLVGAVTEEQARLSQLAPLADDICAEADSGGHTDRRAALTLAPRFRALRDEVAKQYGLPRSARIGAAGGVGTPDAAAACFMLGADFVMTGSINQCTPEAGTSDAVKTMLAAADLADFDIAPAGDMFEIGAKVQVLRRGTLFPGRANRLYELYRSHAGLADIPPPVLAEIEHRYLGRSIDEVWNETARHYARAAPEQLAEAEADPRKKMAMVFRWYFIHSSRMAIEGRANQQANFQIHSGPAMAAANIWLRGSDLEDWRARNVAVLAERLMREAGALFRARLAAMTAPDRVTSLAASSR